MKTDKSGIIGMLWYELAGLKYYLKSLYLGVWVKISPEALVRRLYKKKFGKEINLEDPRTFNEKLNWMKLHWWDERAVICSDKYLVRDYVKQKGLGHILNDLCGEGVYSNPFDIEIDKLPERFVLKGTHGCGFNFICADKKNSDWNAFRRLMRWWLKVDYSFMAAEWPYHAIAPKIICEKYLEDTAVGELLDYKFFCFNGKPELIFFASDRRNHVKSDFYSLDWNLLPFRWLYPPSGKTFPKPKCLNEMIKYAATLSEGFPFVRVDFYEVGGRICFGEMTFFHGAGWGWFKPESVDSDLGDKIVLPKESNPWMADRRR